MGNSFTCVVFQDEDKKTNINSNEMKIDRVEEGKSYQIIQILWEFQRYNPTMGWGGTNNFETGDPGRWATENEETYGDSLTSVAPLVPDEYVIEQNWTIVVKKRVKKKKKSEGGDVDETGITDRFGWHYGKSFKTKTW